ncbi:hypothetical protein [Latilactobacillus curvatus]|uniref:hypothetical protein n=1 Tax=Latilactobacillus curvatus TaxID=28038 RepID=UPI000DAAE646|nr:hypothetical protein [Latilactobacillus curvatus]AWV72540.1 hypothetical protein C0W45_02930 [Latilactobacillus curvatus]
MVKLSVKKQNELIEIEAKTLRDQFRDISGNKRAIAFKLIDRVAFMAITLKILEENIKTKGPVVKMENGKQKLVIENPAQKSYNTMINRYSTAIDKLTSMLPKEYDISSDPSKDSDDFDNFVQNRGD